MHYIMHHGIIIFFQIAVTFWFKGVGAQLGFRTLNLLGTSLTGLGYRSNRLIDVEPMQIHADRSDRSVAPV